MKYVMLLLFLPFCPLSAQTIEEREDSLYVIIYSKGPSWDNTKSPNEQLSFTEHAGFMGKLRKDGFTKVGARYSDKGMIIIGGINESCGRYHCFRPRRRSEVISRGSTKAKCVLRRMHRTTKMIRFQTLQRVQEIYTRVKD
jgi:hypothetical protein